MRLLAGIGAWAETMFSNSGLYTMILIQVVKKLPIRPWYTKQILIQAEEVGVQSLPVVLLTALFTGMVLALQSYIGFHRFGAESMVSMVVSLSMLRELGPVLVGLMVAGRIGAQFAAELGTMRVSQQIDALWTLSTDPFRYLVTPRVIAVTLMLPLLVALADIVGIGGGYLISVGFLDQTPRVYLENSTHFLTLTDFFSGLIKAMVFGAIIGVVGCAEGFHCQGGAQGVGRATTRAMVISAMSILISDYILTAWMFQ
ncbi:MAG: ABC transporter permease [Mariprofundaceae bacterium]|nr:ABC transporter permease [Mariprofundaceae bacterium]